MTRLEAFCASLTREMLEHWHGAQPTERGVAQIAEREVRQFVRNGFTWATDGCRDGNDWLEQPAKY